MSRILLCLLICFALTVTSVPVAGGEKPALPETPKKPVEDIYHGVKVVDDYRWLEKLDDPAVRDWAQRQDAVARARLDGIAALAPLRARLTELMADPQARYFGIKRGGERLFALKEQPPKEQPVLVVLRSADDPEAAKVVIDPTAIDPSGKTTIDFFEPSGDGRLVAVSLSERGTEEGTMHVYDVGTGKPIGGHPHPGPLPEGEGELDVIPRVNYPTAGGSVAWNGSSGFYYARLPRPGERPKEDLNFFQQVFYHQIGTPASADTYVIGKEFPRIAEVFLDESSEGRYLLVTVQKGDSGQFEHFLLGPEGKWQQLMTFADQINAVAIGEGDDRSLYLVTYRDAPKGKILRLPIGENDLARAQTVVPESDTAIVGMRWQGTRMIASHVPTETGLYVLYIDGGPSQLRFFPRGGGQPIDVPLPPVSAVYEIVRQGGDRVLMNIGTYTEPAAWYEYRPGDKSLRKTALARKPPARFDDIEVKRLLATSSKDGTKVPLTVMYRRGLKLDGSAPALLYGYGGYGISMTPSYSAGRRVWFDHGGVYAIANIRGGGEYGEAWHTAAMRTGRQKAYDDFIACAELLIELVYTKPERLAILGGSNGGLLMGVALTQRPELFRAVVSRVGVYDMLRSELSPNGVFNIPEFGTVAKADEFAALHAYSPLHNVREGTKYPAVLLTTGIHDGRVDPANSLKMAARLQAATPSGRPVLLRVTFDSGHGLGENLSREIEEAAEAYAFLFQELGIKY